MYHASCIIVATEGATYLIWPAVFRLFMFDSYHPEPLAATIPRQPLASLPPLLDLVVQRPVVLPIHVLFPEDLAPVRALRRASRQQEQKAPKEDLRRSM
jgi:hypothetical protein